MRSGALPLDRIRGVQTGGCPHTAIREDTSINQEDVDQTLAAFPDVQLLFLESGGDNLAASFSPELVDVSIYVVDVAGGDKVPRKGGPGVTLVRPFPLAGGAQLVQLITLGPGFCGGDRVDLRITAEPDAEVVVTTTAATRVLSMHDGACAGQHVTIVAAAGATVQYYPLV